MDRLARGGDVEGALGDGATDPLGDLERLLDRRLGQQDAELLAPETGGDVVVAELGAEDLGDTAENRVAGEVPVGVVDLAQEIEVDHQHRERVAVAHCPCQLVGEHAREVTCVVETRLGIDTRLLLQAGHCQRALYQSQRSEREQHQPGVGGPDNRNHHTQSRQCQVRGEPGQPGKRPPAADAPVGLALDHRDQPVIDEDERDRRERAGERDLRCAGGGEAIASEDERGGCPGAEGGKRGAGDRGRLDVPRVALPEPLGHVLDDRYEHHELRRQHERGGDDEDGDRLVGVAGGATADEKLAEGCGGGEAGEGSPALGVVAEANDQSGVEAAAGQEEHRIENPRREVAVATRRPGVLARIFIHRGRGDAHGAGAFEPEHPSLELVLMASITPE